jgi:dockerin type I repeat protein
MHKTATLSLIAGICTLLIFSIFKYFPADIFAAGNLSSLSDVISNTTVSAEGVGHEITFTIPQNAAQVVATDYIIISMDNFSDIVAPVSLDGSYTGSPTTTIDDKDVKITGVGILPGHTIIIRGITATNPGMQSYMRILVSITEDEAGNIIKNIGNIYCTRTTGRIAVTATIAPPYASVRISGSAGPGTFITFTENGTVIGTDTAGDGGLFSKYMTGISPGTHTFSMYGVDSSNRTTSILDITADTPIYQETTIEDLLMSPTIEIDSSSITQGDDLVSEGTAIIDGDLSIFTEPQLRTYYATASAVGAWDYTITNTSEYIPGDYHIYTLVQNNGGSQSLFSNALQFTVTSSTGGGNPTCDISQGDLNCDGYINLTDFSILMYYWGTSNAAADINEDSAVNLTDFSIMMYYWGT